MIHQSPHDDIDIPDISISRLVMDGLEARGDAAVLTDGVSGDAVTASELADRIRSLAGGLAARGIGPGRVVALMAPNMPDYCTVFHATLWAGGTITTINPTYTPHELKHQLTDSRAEILFTIPDFLPSARQGVEGTGVKEIVVLGETEGATPLGDLMAEQMAEPVTIDLATGIAAMPYSSGTTGLSKGVMLSHRNLVANTMQVRNSLPVEPGETTVAFLPFFHIYGLTVLMNNYLSSGGHLVTMPRFDLGRFLELTETARPRKLFVVPPVMLALAKHPLIDQHDTSSIEFMMCGAAPLGAELARACAQRMDCIVVQGYGMTELSPVSHVGSVSGGSDPGSSGPAVANTQCRIVDTKTGANLGVGEEGELWVKGPQVMLGYLNNDAATAETISDGWLRTGDLAMVDENGEVHLRERVKELIKVKGFQVAPAELEAVLLSHPGITDAAVRARPDEEAGERPVAFVVKAAGAEIDEQAVKAHIAERLSSYKHLAAVQFLDAIPKSASGKILRRQLPAL